MIRKYLKQVARHHKINLQILEFKHSLSNEEVDSQPDTLYVTNIQDPVEKSISHFKYNAR